MSRFIGTLLDITEQEQMTQELRRREAYLAEAQRLSHTGSFGGRVSSEETFWSEETLRIYGYDRGVKPTVELVLRRVHPEGKAAPRQLIDGASKDAKSLDFEHRF